MAPLSARTIELVSLVLSLSVAAAEPIESEETILGQRVVEMFHVGAVSNPRAVQESQRIYESLSNKSGNDPRIDYAHGLVLLKLLKAKEAQSQFLIATKRPGAAYRPAWQAMIWLCFNAKDYDEGYDRLVEYTKVVLDPEKLSVDFRRDEIYWIGRLMSALEFVLNSPTSRESWTQADKKLTDLFGKEFIDAYADGREDMHIRYGLIKEKIRRDLEKLEDQKSLKREKELKRKGKVLEASTEKSDDLKKSSNEAKETLEEQAATYKKQTQRVEKDLAFLERRATLLTAEILILDQQLSALEQTSKNQNSNVNSNNAQRLNALQSQRFLKDLEFQRITVLAQEVSSNAKQLAEQQAEFLDQSERETAERAEKDKINEKVKGRTEKQIAELKKAEANSKAPGAVNKILATSTLRTFIDFDQAAEREKVLESFGIKPGKK